jgi:hypothetical protein
MKKLLLISILCMVTLAGLSPPGKEIIIPENKPIEPFLRLFRAISFVESHNDSLAYNKITEATGIVQITPILLKDYNRRTGKHYKLKDCYSPKISRIIFNFYCMKLPGIDFEKTSKKWNGSGKATEKYWQRVKSNLK